MERAIFDLRLEIEAETRRDVYDLATAALGVVQRAGLKGVRARYTSLRPARRSRSFVPTMVPSRSPRWNPDWEDDGR